MKKFKVCKLCIAVIFIIAQSFFCFAEENQKSIAVLDFSNVDFSEQKTVSLDGIWSFYWNQLYTPSDFTQNTINTAPVPITLPGPWNDVLINDKPIGAFGYGTYRVLIKTKPGTSRLAIKTLTVSTSMMLWVNGELLIQNGKVGRTASTTVEQYLPSVAVFKPDENGNVEIIAQVANFKYRKGGLWEKIVLGNDKLIENRRLTTLSVSMFLFGALFIMAIYHFGLYFLRRKDRSPLVFGIACLIIALRVLVVDEVPLIQFFPDFNWDLQIRIEFLTIFITFPLYPVLIKSLYKDDVPFWFTIPLIAISSFFIIAAAVLPVSIFNYLILPYQVIMVTTFLIGFAILVRIAYIHKKEAYFILIGFICIIIAGINDMLYTNYILKTGMILPFGLVLFIFFEAVSLSARFSRAFYTVEDLSEKLSRTNASLSRFVPNEFLTFLDKTDITQVELGDQVQRKLTLLFADIRSFTTLSEGLNPKDNFDFLNSYFQKLGPIIRKNNGIIDKYIGDGIMALFPLSCDDALNAAVEMQIALVDFNEERKLLNKIKIQVGIGIHYGDMMLGTVGEETRMDTTVISDAVNVASRIEGLTKNYSAKILVSEAVIDKLKYKENYQIRFLDRLQVKGKKAIIGVYEVVDGDREQFHEKVEYLDDFNKARQSVLNHEFSIALPLFESILAKNPNDAASKVFYERCVKALENVNK